MNKIILISLVVGCLATMLSLTIPRLGTAYKCAGGPIAEAYNRDVRGMPLVYMQRSLEATPFCEFVKESNGTKIYTNHAFEVLPFALDILFWTAIGGGLMYAGKRFGSHE